MRRIQIITGYTMHAEGSVLIEVGNTRVLCNATVEDAVPSFLAGSGLGWVTAEYSMLPRATNTRSPRDISRLKLNGRSAEIQRLIGRSLRSVLDRRMLGERQIIVDCDVLQADGGTRCASITGGYVALWLACRTLVDRGLLRASRSAGRLRRFRSAFSAASQCWTCVIRRIHGLMLTAMSL